MGHFNGSRYVTSAEELQRHGHDAPLGSAGRRARTDYAKEAMTAAGPGGRAPAQRTSFPAGVFADPVDHAEITDVAKHMMEQFSDQPPEVIAGFRQLHKAGVDALAAAGYDPDGVGVHAAADALGGLGDAQEQLYAERVTQADSDELWTWIIGAYGLQTAQGMAERLSSMDPAERLEEFSELESEFFEANPSGYSTDPDYRPADQVSDEPDDGEPSELEQAFDEWAEQTYPNIAEQLAGQPEDAVQATLAALETEFAQAHGFTDPAELADAHGDYEQHGGGELTPAEILSDAGYDIDQVQAYLDGFGDPDEQRAALTDLVAQTGFQVGGDGQGASEYDDDGGYQDDGGWAGGEELAYAGGGGLDDGSFNGTED